MNITDEQSAARCGKGRIERLRGEGGSARRFRRLFTAFVVTAVIGSPPGAIQAQSSPATSYSALTTLFTEWRAFERSPLRDGVPDNTSATMARKQAQLRSWQARLKAIDTTGWTTEQQIDWHLVRAEMNGL